jgi:hypothetical protein
VTILDIIEDLTADYKEDFINGSQPGKPHSLLDSVVILMVVVLRSMESTKLLQHVFAILRSMIVKFRDIIFVLHPTFCSALCAEMLRLCGYNNYTIKEEATSLLYILIRVSFQDKPQPNYKKEEIILEIKLLWKEFWRIWLLPEELLVADL